MPIISGIQYGNESSSYDFGFSNSLDKIQELVTIKDGNNKNGYTLDNHPIYSPDEQVNKNISNSFDYKPENRVRKSKYADPFIPNFKLLIDFDKKYGLFADEQYPNSALAYIKRVFGQNTPRYLMLKSFIDQFKLFIKEYDFLILNVENLDELYSIYNKHTYVEESEIKCNVVIRETITMQLMGLIHLYNMVCYDSMRGVEVLPENLRRFDLYILIFSSGYFSSLLYDIENSITGDKIDDESLQERQLFPTVYKLEQIRQLNKYHLPNIKFNTFVMHLVDAQIDVIESGKKMFGEITNEMSGDYVKNNLSFTARFVNVNGKFAQFDNGIDLFSLLSLESNSKNSGNNSYFKNWASRAYKSLKKEGINLINNSVSHIFDTARSLVSKTSPIGNALSLLSSPEQIAKKLAGAASIPINGVINKYVDSSANWLQSMVQQNFREDILSDLMREAWEKTSFGQKTAVEQIHELQNINDIAAQLPTDVSDTSGNYEFNEKIKPQEIQNVNDAIALSKTLSTQIKAADTLFNEQKSKYKDAVNIEVKPEIPEYNSPENQANIEVQEVINEFKDTNNNLNIEHKEEIPEYKSPENSENIEFKKLINEFKESKNNQNLEIKSEIPEYQETDNKTNIEVQENINEFKESKNNQNLEIKPEIPEYFSPKNTENLEYKKLIEIFGNYDSKTNIEIKTNIPEYQETDNKTNIEVQENINEFKDSVNNNNIEQKDIIPEYQETDNKTNIEVQENINEFKDSVNNNNIEQKDIIPEYQETKNSENIEYQETINNFRNINNNLSNINVESEIETYPDGLNNSNGLNTIELNNPIESYPTTETLSNDNNINPEYKKNIE